MQEISNNPTSIGVHQKLFILLNTDFRVYFKVYTISASFAWGSCSIN